LRSSWQRRLWLVRAKSGSSRTLQTLVRTLAPPQAQAVKAPVAKEPVARRGKRRLGKLVKLAN
jgi:hypothetical protein